MFEIVHLSDIHIGHSEKAEASASALAKYITGRFPEGTVVVITGDLVHTGAASEYERLAATLLNPLREKFTVLTVPGNHDYCADWFGSRFSEESAGLYHGLGYGPFPCVHTVPGEDTVLIGLDSADPDDRVWFSGGLADRRQVSRLKEILTEHASKLKIVYFHHHPFCIRLMMIMWGGSGLLKAMASHGADVALFGHRHWSQVFRDTRGVPLMLASRKSTSPRWFSGKLSFRVLEVGKGEMKGFRSEEFRP